MKFTYDEWQSIVDGDPVLQFIERVNKEAPTRSIWHENYALALYQTFTEKSQEYVIQRYGATEIEMK